MNIWYWMLAVFPLLNLAAGLWRVLRGATRADRMIAAQLFGTTGVGILLLLAPALGSPALQDVALIFALLHGLQAGVQARVIQLGLHYRF